MSPVCSTGGCVRDAWAKGLCQQHYNKARTRKALGLPDRRKDNVPLFINNTAVEVLRALLDKTKTQTIRKLDDGEKPKFKVGDIVSMQWNQRSKEKYFHICGSEIENFYDREKRICKKCKYLVDEHDCFQKLLGTVEITEVFEIEMYECHNQHGHIDIMRDGKPYIGKFAIAYEWFAQKDGFKSWKEFCEYFIKNYELTDKPKRFAVYRWKWL